MQVKKNVGILSALLLLTILIIFLLKESNTIQTITFFPIDPSVKFLYGETAITNVKRTSDNHFSLLWRVESMLDRNAYLRQDIGLLFANGRLIAKQNKWEQNTNVIVQQQTILQENSQLFQAISFHQAEIHHNEEHINSAQIESSKELYVIPTLNSLQIFKQPKTSEQNRLKKALDDTIDAELHSSWSNALKSFHINQDQYISFPLTKLYEFEAKPLQGLSKSKTDQVIGRLWEGLYKNYFLGIKKKNGTIIDPISSTIPLILIAKDLSHILVIFETSDKEPILLRQIIPK